MVRTGYRIYRIRSYSNKPWIVYLGNQKIGSFFSIEEIMKLYPSAKYKKSKKSRIRPYVKKERA